MTALIIASVVIVGILTIFGIIRANLKVCQPNEVLIFSGRQRALPKGGAVGYRVVQGGRGFRVPIIEEVDRLDLTTIPLDLTVSNAYSKGGIPLTVRAIANVKVASQEPLLNNAIERLLGKPRGEIQQIAQETLEGNLRGVLAKLTPEEVNEDRLKFTKEILSEAGDDMDALGLQLDTLKVQSVEDERGYLDAIGRKQTAVIVSEAEIAEAERDEQARLVEAEAERNVAEAENETRVVKAQLDAEAEAEEAKIEVAARLARTQAEQEVADEEITLEEKKQRAETVVKAEADRKAKEERARGQAARIREDGKAEVEVLRQKLELWKAAGPDAEKLFLIQMLPDILSEIIQTVDNLEIDRLTVVDGQGDGTSGVPAVFNQVAGATPALLESIKTSTGIDIGGMLREVADEKIADEVAAIAEATEGNNVSEEDPSSKETEESNKD